MKVLNFGSMNLDYVYTVDHFLTKGETQAATGRTTYTGGKGLNQSVALARAGVFVYHAGNVGAGGEVLLRELAESNVDTTYVRRQDDLPTGHTVIQIDREGDNCILVFGGANRSVTKEQVDENLEAFGEGDFLLLQNEINGLQDIMAAAANRGMRIFFNPSPMDESIFALPLETVDTFVVNEVEAAALTGADPEEPAAEAEQILHSLLEAYPDSTFVLTLGEEGAWYADRETRVFQPAYREVAVDTTGAGDTFLGYYVAGLLRGDTPAEALDLASRAAAICINRPGAAPSIPVLKEVEAFQ